MEFMITLIVLVLFMAFGLPIAFALGAAGIFGIWLKTGDLATVIRAMGMIPFSVVANYNFTTVPMFILMAFFSAEGGLATDLYQAASDWLSHIRGGLGIGTIFATGVFGAMSGTSFASASVMSAIAMPSMRRAGYSESLAAGVIAVGATTDILIPPSIGMVIYGVISQQSIGKLLIAGIMPGILVCVSLILAIFAWVTISPSSAPKTHRCSWKARWESFKRVWSSILLILFVIGFLYLGIATPTEVGALGAFFAGVIGVVTGRLTWAGAVESMKQTISITAMCLAMLIGGIIFGYFLALSQVPQQLMAVVSEMHLNRYTVITLICIGYFVISMFMDEVALMLITVQVSFPLLISLGFDPIWFGVIMMLLVSMGLVFPPVGVTAFVVSTAAKVDLVKVYKGTSILVIALFLSTFLVIVFPQIALWLPSTMK